MERLDYGTQQEGKEKTTKAAKPSKKRKWREIEIIKDKKRLMDELKDIDPSFEYQESELKD